MRISQQLLACLLAGLAVIAVAAAAAAEHDPLGRHGTLGASLRSPSRSRRGADVASVSAGSPAANAAFAQVIGF